MRWLLITILFTMASTSAAWGQGKKYALIVGVKRYDGKTFIKLPSAERDALALDEALRNLGFHVVITMTSEADLPARRPSSAKNILDQLDLIVAGKQADDTLIVFLSGHGIQLKGDPVDENGNKETYFCPEEAKVRDRKSLVPIGVIMNKLSSPNCPAQRKLLLIDSCREEMISEDAPEKAGGVIELEAVGVKRSPPPAGLAALFSCGPGETSHAFRKLEDHGAFTHFTLKYLRGEAEPIWYRKNEMLTQELATYVSRETNDYVVLELGKSQRPELVAPKGFRSWPLGELKSSKEPAMFDATRARTAAEASAAQQAWARYLNVPVELTSPNGPVLRLIPPGEFLMGSSPAELKRLEREFEIKAEQVDDEQPQHGVKIGRAFYLGQYEVTLKEFLVFYHDAKYKLECERDGKGGYGYDPKEKTFGQKSSYLPWSWGYEDQTQQHPVVNVSWNDAKAYCEWLSKKEGRTYRLPTEAEWEYACRAGTMTRHPAGDRTSELVTIANIADKKAKSIPGYPQGIPTADFDDGYGFTAPVGRFDPNSFGLHDLIGNVWEWCEDVYDKDVYKNRTGVTKDPLVQKGSEYRVLRGGSWYDDPGFARTAYRGRLTPDLRNVNIGFRVVCVREGVRTP